MFGGILLCNVVNLRVYTCILLCVESYTSPKIRGLQITFAQEFSDFRSLTLSVPTKIEGSARRPLITMTSMMSLDLMYSSSAMYCSAEYSLAILLSIRRPVVEMSWLPPGAYLTPGSLSESACLYSNLSDCGFYAWPILPEAQSGGKIRYPPRCPSWGGNGFTGRLRWSVWNECMRDCSDCDDIYTSTLSDSNN